MEAYRMKEKNFSCLYEIPWGMGVVEEVEHGIKFE